MRVMLLTEHHLGGCIGSSESTLVKPCLFFSFWLIYFERTSDATIPNVAHVINRPCQGVKTIITEIWVMGRVARKTKVVAFQQQRRRPACADAQSDQRLCCSISGKYN